MASCLSHHTIPVESLGSMEMPLGAVQQRGQDDASIPSLENLEESFLKVGARKSGIPTK